MRRITLPWTITVVSVLMILYGGYFTITKYKVDDVFFITSLIVLIVGFIIFSLMVAYYISLERSRAKRMKEKQKEAEERIKEEEPTYKKETIVSEVKREPRVYQKPSSKNDDYYSSSISSHGYIKKVGYGPVLEISDNRIRDMRNNEYYTIEGNYIYLNGGGLAYEISNNRIRSVGSTYLYEISGNNINKVFGGFFASISGNYLTKYDSSEKYEIGFEVNKSQLLLITVLLFGKY